MTEQQALLLASRGDQAAFAVLVRSHQHAVFNLCSRMLGEAGQAEDAAQETFLRAYTQLHRYDPQRPFRTWLLAVASHHCIDCLRRRRFAWVDIEDEPLAGHPALREPRPGPEEAALCRERQADVQRLLNALPPRDRAAVVMLYWHGLSYQEIAEATGTTVSAVRSRLHRARTAMAEILQRSERTGASHPTSPIPQQASPTGLPAGSWL